MRAALTTNPFSLNLPSPCHINDVRVAKSAMQEYALCMGSALHNKKNKDVENSGSQEKISLGKSR